MNKWGFQNEVKITTKKLHQLHYRIIIKCFTPQIMIYLESTVKQFCTYIKLLFWGDLSQCHKRTVSFNLNIFGKYTSVNPDSNFVVKMLSQKTQLYPQGCTRKRIFRTHKHHRGIRCTECHDLWQFSIIKLN